jgi:hypothetical protein
MHNNAQKHNCDYGCGEKLLFIPVPTISLTFSAGKPQILAPAWVKIKMRALFVCVMNTQCITRVRERLSVLHVSFWFSVRKMFVFK